ncbi:MAG TPA: lipoyl synthase [Deltaproteobacteria bacterium]|nr:lipoyl synthase [Deltaproteobacteria bacterium]
MCNEPGRLPSWLRKKKSLRDLRSMKILFRSACLSTVCEEARCPNITECFRSPTATFMILGDVCTRKCAFCSVKKGFPCLPDEQEPEKMALAASKMGLDHVVITSVTRDDLPDHGASAFARSIRKVRQALPCSSVEVLTPDFSGNVSHAEIVFKHEPDVFNHNVETVGRLYRSIRPGARLETSLELLKAAREYDDSLVVKSGFMVGLGETEEEIHELIVSLHQAGCDIITIGQYMQPTKKQVPVQRYWHPERFEAWSELAKNLGIRYAVSGPLIRSSYRAKEALEMVRLTRRKTWE